MRKMRPEFFIAIMNKLVEVISDEKLAGTYTDRLDLIQDVHNFLFFGILPAREEQD